MKYMGRHTVSGRAIYQNDDKYYYLEEGNFIIMDSIFETRSGSAGFHNEVSKRRWEDPEVFNEEKIVETTKAIEELHKSYLDVMEKNKTIISSSSKDKEVKNHHIIDMVKSILSACIQKGVDSVSIDEIKQFYHFSNFNECWEEMKNYINTHSFKDLEESKTYSFDLKRKLFNGRIVNGYGVQSAIIKSDN